MGGVVFGLKSLFLPEHGVWAASCHDRYVLRVRGLGLVVDDTQFIEAHQGNEGVDDLVAERFVSCSFSLCAPG